MLKHKKLIVNIFSFIMAAGLLTLFLEYRYFINDFGAAWDFLITRPLVFWFNAFLMGLILAMVTGITRKPWRSVGVMTAGILILTYIHINKYISRGTPLLPEDFQLASQVASLSKFVNVWGIVGLIVMSAAAVAVAWVISAKTEKPEPGCALKWQPRVGLIVGSMMIFAVATGFVRHHAGARYEYIQWLDTTFTAWNQTRNYDENGFILGFLYNWSKMKIEAPEGYDEETVAEIAETYAEEKVEDETENPRTSLKDADYNIVMILNESFYDPSIIAEFYPYSDGDVTPNLHKIMKNYPSGWMYSLDYGGGTANIEFEALTGLTNYWLNTVPYTDLIPKAGTVPSVATWGKQNGYETVAIHAYNGGMYKRNISLLNEGFDTFITDAEMRHQEHAGSSEYIDDRSSYQEVLDVLSEKEQKQMVALITMQNHTPYNEGTYGENQFRLQTLEDDPERKSSIETYYQSLYLSDQYLGEFIAALEKSEEKTVVLFFGDHSAGLFHELNDSENDSREFFLSRLTPYFIYTNFTVETEAPGELPSTTPNCLTNTLYDYLNVEKPALGYLTAAVCRDVPILAETYFGDDELPEMKTLKDYQMATYDILAGERYLMP